VDKQTHTHSIHGLDNVNLRTGWFTVNSMTAKVLKLL